MEASYEPLSLPSPRCAGRGLTMYLTDLESIFLSSPRAAGREFAKHIRALNPLTLRVVPSSSPPHTCGGEGWGEEAPCSMGGSWRRVCVKFSSKQFANA